MVPRRERTTTQTWIADFIVAGILAVIVTFLLMDWLATDKCLDAGGAVRTAGADTFCDTVEGSRPLSSVLPGSAIFYVWLGATAVFLVLARLFIKRGASKGSHKAR
jgi:hypothetical protein